MRVSSFKSSRAVSMRSRHSRQEFRKSTQPGNSIVWITRIVPPPPDNYTRHPYSSGSGDVRPRVIRHINARFRRDTQSFCNQTEGFVTRFDTWSIFSRNHHSLEQLMERDASDPFPFHPRRSITVRDETDLEAHPLDSAERRLRIAERWAVLGVCVPIAKGYPVDQWDAGANVQLGQ